MTQTTRAGSSRYYGALQLVRRNIKRGSLLVFLCVFFSFPLYKLTRNPEALEQGDTFTNVSFSLLSFFFFFQRPNRTCSTLSFSRSLPEYLYSPFLRSHGLPPHPQTLHGLYAKCPGLGQRQMRVPAPQAPYPLLPLIHPDYAAMGAEPVNCSLTANAEEELLEG